VGESVIEESAQDGSGGGLVGRAQDSIGSWIQSVESILDELASTGDAPVRAADGTGLCPGSECGSTLDPSGSQALTFILIGVILATAGKLASLAGRRRVDNPADPGTPRTS
jgi:hypothetical protein